MTEERYVFVTADGEELTFDDEVSMMEYGARLTLNFLVNKSFGTLSIIDGEEAFKINEAGLAYLRQEGYSTTH